MPNLQTLLDKRAQAWDKAQEFQSRGDDKPLSAEDRSAWDAALADVEQLSKDIETEERHARLSSVDYSQVIDARADTEEAEEARARHGGEAGVEAYTAAYRSWMRDGTSELTSEERTVLRTGWVDGKELRAQGVATGAAGGYLVPPEFRAKMVEAMRFYGAMREVSEVITTSTGADLNWPTNDDTSNEGEILGENTAAGEQDIQVGGKKLKAYTFSSKQVRLSLQLLQDSAFGLETWVPKKLGERIGRRAARAWTTGTGVDQPEGITTSATVGKTGAAGQVTSIIYDDLVDIEHSVDVAYRASAQYLMHDLMLKVIRKLKDTQGRPLWQPIPAPGFPATINGFTYNIDNSMPIPAASAKSIAFGDFKAGYLIRQVLDVQTLRLVERYAEYLQVAFLGFSRMDGMIQDSSAVRLYQHAAS